MASETGCTSCPAVGAVSDGTDKALAAGTGELQLLVTNSRGMCDLIVTVLSGDT